MPTMSAASRRRRSVRRIGPITGLPDWIPPQLTKLTETVPEGDQWAHEIKLDGYRMHARLDRGEVKLFTRTGLDWTEKYPTTITALRAISAQQAYIDGELCAADKISSAWKALYRSGWAIPMCPATAGYG